MTPQRYHVLRLAIDSPAFTRADAATHVGCYELAARIGELEAEGVQFDRERRTVPARYGGVTRVTEYRLAHCPAAVRARAEGAS